MVGASARAAPVSLRRHPAFRMWTPPKTPTAAPMAAQVTDLSGRTLSLQQWFKGEAAIFVFWATWCGPCLAETPDLNRLQRRLTAIGARTLVRPVHADDDEANLAKARAVLNKLGATDLEAVQASTGLEKAGLKIFGKSPVEPVRTSLPALMLVNPSGQVVGARIGTVEPERGQPPYWDDPRTLDLFVQLGMMA
ncbi:MAG TPA: TlpA disulfide reductase family protein [Caulobacteraceae bacterium]|nr:TlpA disulfide reductase family protein [Caulobacteraceae bacterium]